MQILSTTAAELPVPDSLNARVLSIAVVGPNGQLRDDLVNALQSTHEGQVREFSAYPPSLDDIPRLLEQQHDVIMIELDSNPEYALDLVESVCTNRVATVMVYSNYSDRELADPDILVRCMRAGAREFLSRPFGEAAVAEALIRAVARRSANRTEQKTSGRLLVVGGVKGGTGVTSIACNLAIALAETAPNEKTLLIDFDLPLGDASLLLGVTPQYTTIDALQNHGRLDANFLSKLLISHNSGLQVLAAPGKMVSFTPAPEAIENLIQIARQEFENVVVDVGSKRDIRGTALVEQASTIYLVVQSGVSELRNANRLITECFGPDAAKLEVVLNRCQPRGHGLSEEDVRRALTKSVDWKIPNDYVAVRRMQNIAKPVMSVDSPIADAIGKMARTVYGLPDPPAKRRGFSLLGIGKSTSPEVEESADITRLGLTGDRDSGASATAGTAGPKENDIERTSRNYNHPESEFQVSEDCSRANDGQSSPQATSEEEEAPGETPVIVWSSPEPISYGTPLSAVQYNPSASVSGRFDLTPAPGFILPAGRHTLWATFTPDKHSGKTPIQTGVSIRVNKAIPSVLWEPPAEIAFGNPLSAVQLSAVAEVPGTFVYSHAEGNVLAEGAHELSVVFRPEDPENYEEVTASVCLRVSKPTPSLTWPSPSPLTYGAALGHEQLNAVASVPGTFEYSPAEGTTLPAGEHPLTARFTPEDGEAFGVAQATVLLRVVPATPAIIWRTPSTIPFGIALSEIQFNATASVPGAFKYSPAEGEILPAGRHSLTVVFSPADHVNYTSATASVVMTVAKSKPAISWVAPASITYGTPLSSRQLNATSPVAGTFHYIPGPGAVLAAGKHMPSVIFTPEDKGNYSQAQCAVPLIVAKLVPSIQWQTPDRIAYGTPISSVQLCASASIPGTFAYKPGIGEVLSIGEHALSVTFTPADTTNYTPAQSTVPLLVSEGIPPSIDWTQPEPIVYGTPLTNTQLNATASVEGVFRYSSGPGEVLPTGRHTLTASFVPSDKNLSSAQARTTLVVKKASPVIQWNEPASIVFGTALDEQQLNARASTAGAFQYTPAMGEIPPAGEQTISVLFTPTDQINFTEARGAVSLIVGKALPSIAWQKPESISYGTALSPRQLNASASVPGTMTYVPTEGTVLTPGRHSLAVYFSPTDTANYENAQGAVVLEVNGLISEIPEAPSYIHDEAVVVPCTRFVETPVAETERQDASPRLTEVLRPARALSAAESPAHAEPTRASLTPEARLWGGNIPALKPQPETRTYRGNTYVKGDDGQWHLQKQ